MKTIKLLLNCTVNGKLGKAGELHEVSDQDAKTLMTSNIAAQATEEDEKKAAAAQDQKAKK